MLDFINRQFDHIYWQNHSPRGRHFWIAARSLYILSCAAIGGYFSYRGGEIISPESTGIIGEAIEHGTEVTLTALGSVAAGTVANWTKLHDSADYRLHSALAFKRDMDSPRK